MSVDVEEVTTVQAPSQLRQDLTVLLERLDSDGWVQCSVGSPGQPSCIIGHLSWMRLDEERYHAAAAAIRVELPNYSYRGIPTFNDSPRTRLADVRGVLVQAIEAS